MILAADALDGLTGASGIFRDAAALTAVQPEGCGCAPR